ncbi:MAG: CzcA family heavy metal efflux pump [Rhodothermales bacterium]|jgi:CzcA family heavy metal efflux pump
MNSLIKFAIDNRLFVVALALIVAIAGGYQATRMPIDVLPDLNRPTVVVMTEAHAMVPEDVEQLVSLPLERALNGASGVTRVRSQSGLGLSVVTVEFDWGTDIYRNRQIVQEKLQLSRGRLPQDVEPQMAPISSIMGQVQMIGLYSRDGKTPLTDIRALVDNDLRYRLMAVPGVAKVIIMGGAPRQLQVELDADKLRSFDVTVEEVAAAIDSSNQNASGGFLEVGASAPVITLTGLLSGQDELADAIVKPHPTRPVRVRDIGTVAFGPAAIRSGEAGVNGRPGCVAIINKQPGYDTVQLTEAVHEVLDSFAVGLAADLELVPDLFQQADFIHRAIDNVIEAARDGAIMVVIVLFLFLLNFRTTFITLTAIPLSVATTAIVFAAFDLGINTMTLGGLAVAIGALVDDAIVDVENVFRRLKQNAAGPKLPALRVVFEASSEVRKPIIVGTALVMIVYLPLFFLSGLEGRLFAPIGLAYIISVAASLAVSLTVTPALCAYLLPSFVDKKPAGPSPVVRLLNALAERVIRFSIRQAPHMLAILAALVTMGVMLLAVRGSQFLPEFNEGVAQINLMLPPETGLQTSDEFGQRKEAILLEIEGVKYAARRTGRAEGDEHAMGANATETIITFADDSTRSRAEMLADIREQLGDAFPGVPVGVDQPLQHLLSHMLSGVKAQVAIKIFGPSLDELRRLAGEAEAAVKPISGVADLYVEQQVLVPSVQVAPNREMLARYGLSVRQLAETIELAMGGEAVSTMLDGQFSYPIVLRLAEKDRSDLARLRELLIHTEGRTLRLGDVADVRETRTPSNINRENVSRRIVVQHNVAGRPLGDVVADVQKALAPVRERIGQLEGYRIEISGQFEAQQAATRRILLLSILSLAIMVLILYLHFGSLNLSLQVLASIPMAFVGAVIYIVVSNQTPSVATLVGLISLGGIASRNAILLIDHYLHMMKHEGMAFGEELIVRAGQERMVPVMMTALTSGIGLIPLALAPGQPGKELLYPVATVIIGGLISCTLLDFIVRPALFSLFGRKEAERLSGESEVSL